MTFSDYDHSYDLHSAKYNRDYFEPVPPQASKETRAVTERNTNSASSGDVLEEHGTRSGIGSAETGLRVWSKQEIIDLISIHSASYGLDPALPIAIARCESGLRWDAKNSTSQASGVMQYLPSTWSNTVEGRKGTSVFDADASIRMAVTHIATKGTSPWNASRHCWEP
jgi:transglycosylase-like protein with SLT domain